MGLIQPRGPDWGFCAHNYGSAPEAAALGTAITAGANNADGAAVTVLSALSQDIEYLRLLPHGSGIDATQGINADISITVLIDPAGGTSWANLISSLLAGRAAGVAAGTRNPGGGYDFPLWVPAGASIGAMARTSHNADLTVRMIAMGYGGNANPASWWSGQRIVTHGANAAASRGTLVTLGGSGAFGSWTNIGSTLPSEAGAFQVGFTGEGDNDWTSGDQLIELGVSSTRIGMPMFRNQTLNEVSIWIQSGLQYKRLAAGTQLQARGLCSINSVPLGICAYTVH